MVIFNFTADVSTVAKKNQRLYIHFKHFKHYLKTQMLDVPTLHKTVARVYVS